MVANCRVKIAMSLSLTPPPNPGRLNWMSLAFCLTEVARICCFRSWATTASRLGASISPEMVWPPRVRPTYANIGMVRSSTRAPAGRAAAYRRAPATAPGWARWIICISSSGRVEAATACSMVILRFT